MGNQCMGQPMAGGVWLGGVRLPNRIDIYRRMAGRPQLRERAAAKPGAFDRPHDLVCCSVNHDACLYFPG